MTILQKFWFFSVCFFFVTGGYGEESSRSAQPFNVDAADSINADDLAPGRITGLDLTGAGVIVGVWDGGSVRATHQEFFPGQVTNMDTDSFLDNHATHVTGTIAAQGTDPAARGMAPDVTIYAWDFALDLFEIEFVADSLHISNHSYGPQQGWGGFKDVIDYGTVDFWRGNYSQNGAAGEAAAFGQYSSKSRHIDEIMVANPTYLSIWAAGNERGHRHQGADGDSFYTFFDDPPDEYLHDAGGGYFVVSPDTGHPIPGGDGNNGTGYDSLPPEGQTAKNTLVVGALRDYTQDPHDGAEMETTEFTSYGGTDDGRLGVDVVANGESVYSPIMYSDSSYATQDGTSMAAPTVTGTAALLHEHYQNLHGHIPLATTQKGILIHNATDVTNAAFGGQPGPDYATGFGMVNGKAAADFLSADALGGGSQHLIEDTLFNNSLNLYQDWVLDEHGEIKLTLVWNDPAGNPQTGLDNRSPALVNDLDLRLTGPDDTMYLPWVLDIENPDEAATFGDNDVDVVEQILLTGMTPGTAWTFEVFHEGALQSSTQDYSLLVTGLAIPESSTLILSAIFMMAVALGLHRRNA